MRFNVLAESVLESSDMNDIAFPNSGIVYSPVPFILVTSIIVGIILIAVFVFLIVLAIKTLLRYQNTSEVRSEKALVRRSLGEALKEHRMKCNMTQEFVAETIGVSRQAVSKWETGTADPSTANLLSLAKLYGVSAEELLKSVSTEERPKNN